MASPKKSFADGFTIASLIGGSDTPPGNPGRGGSGSVKGSGQGYRGAPTLNSVNRGEKVTTSDTGDKDIYPPVYGGGKRQITVTAAKRRGTAGAGGYKPSATDQTNSPNAS